MCCADSCAAVHFCSCLGRQRRKIAVGREECCVVFIHLAWSVLLLLLLCSGRYLRGNKKLLLAEVALLLRRCHGSRSRRAWLDVDDEGLLLPGKHRQHSGALFLAAGALLVVSVTPTWSLRCHCLADDRGILVLLLVAVSFWQLLGGCYLRQTCIRNTHKQRHSAVVFSSLGGAVDTGGVGGAVRCCFFTAITSHRI